VRWGEQRGLGGNHQGKEKVSPGDKFGEKGSQERGGRKGMGEKRELFSGVGRGGTGRQGGHPEPTLLNRPSGKEKSRTGGENKLQRQMTLQNIRLKDGGTHVMKSLQGATYKGCLNFTFLNSGR